jgi:hypothetical protein
MEGPAFFVSAADGLAAANRGRGAQRLSAAALGQLHVSQLAAQDFHH